MKRKLITGVLSMVAVLSMALTAQAASWQTSDAGWWYQNDDGSYPKSTWQWIDGNLDGTAESYYFNENGYLLTNTTTSDGYTVNGEGAWIQGGVLQQQSTSQGSSVSQPNDPKAIYEAASKKIASLGSLDTEISIDLGLTAKGETMNMSIEMAAKYKDVNTSNMKFWALMRMGMDGQTLDGTVFYTDGYYYTDMYGQKIKTPMDLNTMISQMQSATGITTGNLEYMKNLQLSSDGSENQVIRYEIDGNTLMNQVNQIYQTMGLDMSNMNINLKDISGTAVINPAGYTQWENINMTMELAAAGEVVTVVMDTKVNYKNPGQSVDFALPSTAGYEEAK